MTKKNTTPATVTAAKDSALALSVKGYVELADRYETGVSELARYIQSEVQQKEFSLNGFAQVAQAETANSFAKRATIQRLYKAAEIADTVKAGEDVILITYQALTYSVKASELTQIAETVKDLSTPAKRGKAYQDSVTPLVDGKRKKKAAGSKGKADTEGKAPDTETEAPVTESDKANKLIDSLRDTLAALEDTKLTQAQRDRVSDMLATFAAVLA